MPIRALDTGNCEPALAFLGRLASARSRAHWEWKYRIGRDGGPRAFYWEEPDGRVLGFIGMMRTTLHDGARQHPAAWFVDWHVAPGERSVGVGLGLLRKAEAEAGVLLTLQGSRDTRDILPRLGWKESTRPVTWVLPLSARFIADRLTPRAPALLRVPAAVAGVAGQVHFRVQRPEAPAGARLAEVERIPPEYDRVWNARAVEIAPAMARDSDYLNYLCADYPDGGYRVQLAYAGDEPIGHLIWRVDEDRRGLRRGRVVDVIWPRSEPGVGYWLMGSACWQMQEEKADYVECLLSHPDLEAMAKDLRFRYRRPVPIWYHRLPAEVPDPDHWYISLLDCDRAYR